MNAPAMDTHRPPDSLTRTLANWRVAAPRNPHFRAEVWTRIQAAGDALPWGAYVRRHAAALSGALALAVAAGAVTGQGWARAQTAAKSAKLAAAYVESLDARVLSSK
jgi:hypothetical protein